MVGLTSVTFRQASIDEIIAFAVKTGVEGIEWGGDVHVPAGNVAIAQETAEKTKGAGLVVTSYGSYYRLGEHQSHEEITASFSLVLASAVALGAPHIRIWAGVMGTGSAVCNETTRNAIVKELKLICGLAAEKGIKIGLEYHRETLTDTAQSTMQLLAQAACENLFTYWQMNPDLPYETHLKEIAMLKDFVGAVHVFYWIPAEDRYTQLEDHVAEWSGYVAALSGRDVPYMIEFVKHGTFEQGEREVAALKSFLVNA